jgi:hypothetical protein
MLTLEHAVSSNVSRIVQQRAVMNIYNRIRVQASIASGHMRIAVKRHESEAVFE